MLGAFAHSATDAAHVARRSLIPVNRPGLMPFHFEFGRELVIVSAIREGSPFRSGPLRTINDLEWVTADWVEWYDARRLHSTIGDTPPDEFEAKYYAGLEAPSQPVVERAWSGNESGTVHS